VAEPFSWRPEVVCAFDDNGSAALARALDVPTAQIAVHRFPDNEARVRLTDCAEVSGRRVALYRSLDDPDAKLIEILLAAAALRDAGARSVTLIAPYLCYMRQDKAFHPGEAVSQRVIGGLLAQAFDGIAAVDPHLHRTPTLTQALGGKPGLTLSAGPVVAAYLRRSPWAQPALLVGPDEESAPIVRRIAAALDSPWAVCRKVRQADRSVGLALPDGQSLSRPIVVIDDIISTGGTITVLAALLKSAGAGPISVCATHALFDDDDEAVMRNAGVERIVSCDGVPHPSNAIALAPLIAAGLSAPKDIDHVG
jgi:ribose-phosphate pyrophosphokinase